MYGWSSFRKRRPRPEEHSGQWADFISRHEQECERALHADGHCVQELVNLLLKRTSDERNLFAAMNHIAVYGGKAPGPNGLRIEDFTDPERWDIARALRDAIRADEYSPGSDRTVEIPKDDDDSGTRRLTLQNIEDRIVQRAAFQIIQPLIDPRFDPRSFGYRPKRDRRNALALPTYLAETQNRWFWVAADVKSAFDRVPRMRLLDVLRRQLPNIELVDFIGKLITKGTKRGIRQGGALSPFLLNVFLDYFIDQRWRKLQPQVPLIRYADDVLVLCRTKSEAKRMHEELQKLFRESGVPLKKPEGDPIVDLRHGGKLEWLGYSIVRQAGEIRVQLDELTWESLEKSLDSVRERPDASLRANDAIRSWIAQAGPARPKTRTERDKLLRRIQTIAKRHGFDEVPSLKELASMLNAAYAKWCQIERKIQRMESPEAEASRHVRVPPGITTQQTVTIHTDGCCLYPERVGGCAWITRDEQTGQIVRRRKRSRNTTNNRMELHAVIEALSALPSPTRVHLRTDSLYVAKGLSEWLNGWKANDWHTLGGKRRPVKNRILWEALDQLLNQHLVSVEWVRGHAGDQWNEECDRLAHQAAQSFPKLQATN